jgi:hypothetical protein
MDKKEITLAEVAEGLKRIVNADPEFDYPQQGDDDDDRCECVYLGDDDDWDSAIDESYDYSNCKWHIDDDNTCRYVHPDGSPSCVVGHYYYKDLGIPIEFLENYETKAPTRILEDYGYTVDASAQVFLNNIQSNQDQGREWVDAYEEAEKAVHRREQATIEASLKD